MFVVAVQVLAGSTYQWHFIPVYLALTLVPPHGALCLYRVYVLYGRSYRILAFLCVIGLVALINAAVCPSSRTSK
jgi:hypothetical protein